MIQFENVTKMYPKTEKAALNGVNLDISKGEFVFLVGLSGSGKSTFLRLVLREERPTTGVIHVAGKDLSTLAAHKVPELRRQVGTVFQYFRLLPNKTVYQADNIDLLRGGIGLHGLDPDYECGDFLHEIPHHPAHQGQEKQQGDEHHQDLGRIDKGGFLNLGQGLKQANNDPDNQTGNHHGSRKGNRQKYRITS